MGNISAITMLTQGLQSFLHLDLRLISPLSPLSKNWIDFTKFLQKVMRLFWQFSHFVFYSFLSRPDTIYSIRIQAVNCVGAGSFSSSTRFSTRPLPPAPPRCECVNATHNSLKLKWGDNKSTNTLLEPCQYTLEMEKSRNQ